MLFPCKYPEFFARAFGARIKYTQILFKTSKIRKCFTFCRRRAKIDDFLDRNAQNALNFVFKTEICEKFPF